MLLHEVDVGHADGGGHVMGLCELSAVGQVIGKEIFKYLGRS